MTELNGTDDIPDHRIFSQPLQWVQDNKRGVLTHVQRSHQPWYRINPFQWVQDTRRGVLTHVQRSRQTFYRINPFQWVQDFGG